MFDMVKVTDDGFAGSYGPDGSTVTRGRKKNSAAIPPINVAAANKPAGRKRHRERFGGWYRHSRGTGGLGIGLRVRERGIYFTLTVNLPKHKLSRPVCRSHDPIIALKPQSDSYALDHQCQQFLILRIEGTCHQHL